MPPNEGDRWVQTARIKIESTTRIKHIDDYVQQYRLNMANSKYAAARDALNKMGAIVDQCKLDVSALKRMKETDGT
jgi:hypothetical protein